MDADQGHEQGTNGDVVERVGPGGPPPGLLAVILVVGLMALVLYALATRPVPASPPRLALQSAAPAPRTSPVLSPLPDRCPPPSSCLPPAPPSTPARSVADGVTLAAPRPGVPVFTGLPVEVVGRGAGGIHALRAIITVGDRRIGAAFLYVDAAGRFRGRVPLYPAVEAAEAELFLQDAGRGTYLASRPLTLAPAVPVSLWSPAHPGDGATSPLSRTARHLAVSGASLERIASVSATLVRGNGTVVAAVAGPTRHAFGPWRAFELELPLPGRLPRGGLSLVVKWTDPQTNEESPPIRVPLQGD